MLKTTDNISSNSFESAKRIRIFKETGAEAMSKATNYDCKFSIL